jgi:hypothetical protein
MYTTQINYYRNSWQSTTWETYPFAMKYSHHRLSSVWSPLNNWKEYLNHKPKKQSIWSSNPSKPVSSQPVSKSISTTISPSTPQLTTNIPKSDKYNLNTEKTSFTKIPSKYRAKLEDYKQRTIWKTKLW